LVNYAFSECLVCDVEEDTFAAGQHGYYVVIAVQLLLQNTEVYYGFISAAFLDQLLFGDCVEKPARYFVIDFE
jgi:hypothetical protein